MTSTKRLLIAFVLLISAAGASWSLMMTGKYGWTLFVLVPIFMGALSSWLFRPGSGSAALFAGILGAALPTLLLLAVGWEGIGCIAMCIPLVSPLGAIGGWLAFTARRHESNPRGAAMLMLLPIASLTFDLTAPPTVFKVHSEVVIAASPQTVWNHVVTFSDLPDPTEWYFRGGTAYPKRARIEGTGPGATRYCEFSTGPFVEPIDVWDAPHRLAFHVTQNPAPMEEFSPYGRIVPKHLHGYMISKHGEFRLTPLAGGKTLLEGNTWYQHGLWPGEYWRWWSDAIIHRIHLRVLNHIKQLAEHDRG